MAGIIKFCIRSYVDVNTNPLPSGTTEHSGRVEQIKFNPGFILTNGNNSDLVSFVSHFRYWMWRGTKVLVTPLARIGLDPARVVGPNGPVETIDPFDLSLFHSYKLDNWGPQTVPLQPHDANDDLAFIMDMSWKKCSILKPFSLFIRPRGYQVLYSRPEYTEIYDRTGVFDPALLHATAQDQRMEDKNRVILTEEEYPLPSRGTPGMIGDENKEAWTYSSDGTGADHYRIRAGRNETLGQDGYNRAIIQNHNHGEPLSNPIYRGSFLRAHGHLLPSQELAEGLQFDYGDSDDDDVPGSGCGASYRAPNAYVIPPGFAYSGRSRSAGGWWPTRTWQQVGSTTQVSSLQSFDYPGFLWRIPNHLRTKIYFRMWYFHYFALKSPITHVRWNPYTGEPEPRDMKYDVGVWSFKPDGCDGVLTEEEYRAFYSRDRSGVEADLQDVPSSPSP